MSGRIFLGSLLLLSFSTITGLCEAQTSLDVLYVQRHSTIFTYDVDSTTLQAKAVGQPLNMPNLAQVIPSPNGHFLYVIAGAQSSQESISVYATDASGVPQTPAVQTFVPATETIAEFTIHPSGQFAYLLEYTGQGIFTYDMRFFNIDGTTGELSESPLVLQTFPTSDYCGAGFAGFYPDGTALDYAWACYYPDANTANYYSQHLDPQTGELAPPVQFLSCDDPSNMGDEVLLSNRTINDFQIQNSQGVLLIYPFGNTLSPIIVCGADMLLACVDAGSFSQDVSGQYLILGMSVYNRFEITKIDFAENRIVDSGGSFSILAQPYFSPDDRIMYTATYPYNSDSTIQIYGFNQDTGAIIPGGEITISSLWNVFPAVRN